MTSHTFRSGSLMAAVVLAVAAPGAAAADPRQGGTLAVGIAQDPAVIDPIRTGTFTERQLSTPVYEALFDIDPNGRAVPLLVDSFTVSDDLKTWTFKLKSGIKFHDGTPFDSAAVVANFDRTRDPANRCRCLSNWGDFAGYKAIDPLTVEVRTTRAMSPLPTTLADAIGIMVSPAAFKADPRGIGTRPVGTGPFRFVEWVRNSRVVFERNPGYWQQGKPYLDRVEFRGVQNTETREATFKAGQTDIIMQPSMHFVSQAKNDRRNVVLNPAGFGTDGVYFNSKTPPLDDLRVRRAIVHSIDRELLRKTLWFSVATPAYSVFGRGISMVKQPVEDYPRYDPAAAKKLVAEYGKPVEFKLQYNNDPQTRHLVQSLQEMMAAVGVKAELVPFDQNRLVQNMTTKNFEAAIFRFTGRADPHSNSYPFLHSQFADRNPSSNYGSWSNKRVDELLEQGMAIADAGKRGEIYSELARVLAREVLPHAYLSNVSDTIVTKRHVKDVVVVPDGLIRFGGVWRQ